MVYRKRRLPGPEKLRKIYIEDLLTGTEIAEKYNVNTSYVYAELRRLNISAKEVCNIPVTCSQCKKIFTVQRHRIKSVRRSKGHFNHYCSPKCYYKSRKSKFKVRKRTSFSSRRIVAQHLPFPLKSKMIVHHVNNDSDDLRLENLWLFKSQADHASFHHRTRANKNRSVDDQLKVPVPIWKGSDATSS